jgi:hypothetical protein
MKLSELVERLEELRDDFGDDADPEVVAAYQPNYPLSGTILGAVKLEEDDDEESDDIGEGDTGVVWIAIGSHPHDLSPYAPSAVFKEV